jgi:hypothetical protein
MVVEKRQWQRRQKLGAKAQGAALFRLVIAIAAALLVPPATAHNQWVDGKPVPDWIKAACCGPADAHHLTPAMVHHVDAHEAARMRPKWGPHDNDKNGYYVVDGVDAPIYDQNRNILPSQDGEYWIFYRDEECGYRSEEHDYLCSNEPQANVFCFFIPMGF